MQLEELTKTQIILLTLLTSFVTSIATGITTVTLMDQAPPGVTQTINRVVERTVEVIVPEKSQGANVNKTVIVREEDFIVDATKINAKNLVTMSVKEGEKSNALGVGFIVSASGIVATDKSLLPSQEGEEVQKIFMGTTQEGITREMTLLDIAHEDLAFFKMKPRVEGEGGKEERLLFTKPTFTKDSAVRLGQTAVVLGFDETASVLVGVVSRLEMKKDTATSTPTTEVSSLYRVYTTLTANKHYLGGPFIDTNTDILGIAIKGESGHLIAVPSSDIVEALRLYHEAVSRKEGGGTDV
ncbi:MAG: trypsin-like peptidase domain-containing protein [Candidatus Paceibacterota bacterium]